MELEKNDSKMLHGLAVMAMVMLHLFDRVDYQGLFQPLVFIKGIPLSFFIAQLSDFCVFCFAFCSGYAHMKLYENEHYYVRRLKSLLRLLIQYWLVIILFSIVAVLIGESSFMPDNVRTLAGNAFLYKITYCGAWWYMWAYTLIVLISPGIIRICKKWHPLLVLSIGFIIYCSAYYVRFNMEASNYLLEKYGPFGMTLFEYVVGCMCYRTKFFSQAYKYWRQLGLIWRWIVAIIIIVCLLLFRTLIVPSLFVAPCSGAFIITLFHFWRKPEWIKKVFSVVGEHSTNIWLTHMFFYLYLFKNFVYIARYPLLIFCLMMLITIGVSRLLKLIEKPLIKILF